MNIKNETWIGIFVTICCLILFVLTWKAGNFDFAPKGYELKVQFKDVDGVALNAPVYLNGMEVGRVRGIQILNGPPTRVEVALWLHSKAQIHQGCKAYVKNMGFMGEKLVALTTGDDALQFLTPGTVLQGEEPVDFQKVLSEGQVIASNLKEITRQLDERLKVNSPAVDQIVADTRVMMKNLATISDTVNGPIVTNLNVTSKNLEEMSYDLKDNPWKLLYKPRQVTKTPVNQELRLSHP